jgi:hypothetical protein
MAAPKRIRKQKTAPLEKNPEPLTIYIYNLETRSAPSPKYPLATPDHTETVQTDFVLKVKRQKGKPFFPLLNK